MHQLSFKRHRFPPDIIRHAIWLYARFTLSFRDVEEILAERGLDVSYETVRRWFLKFGSIISANLRRDRCGPVSGHRHSQHQLMNPLPNRPIRRFRPVGAPTAAESYTPTPGHHQGPDRAVRR